MAFLDKDELFTAYKLASDEADIWREHYPEYERLMDNGLMDGLDENLPEVNDGSLAASLFKLSKRVIKKNIDGRPKALDRDDKWINDIADIQWRNQILPNANSMATPRQKKKDAARKAAGYGGQPTITLFTDHGADFIVPYCQDVKLEAGKASDLDSDVIFWDVYYTKLQLKNMIEQAEAEMKDKTNDGYNKWDVKALKDILNQPEEDRPGNEEHADKLNKGVKKNGYHFFIAFQRGVEAPFYMCYPQTKASVREWSNPDPTGDVPVHYLYFYQDFINPYGIGIVKLAGGTQNVLDYMRQADVLATQLGIRPPKIIRNPDSVDEESLVYAQDANWYVEGNGDVERQEMSNQVYQQLPGRISMYQTSLQKMIPMGDTSISAENSGDPMVGKTPQALKMAAASLSVDDEDFSENVDEWWGRVVKSMINTHFANMQGTDLMRLSAEEIEILTAAGIQFPMDENGEPSHELEIQWDDLRASFDFEIDADADKTQDEEAALEGKLRAYEMINADPNVDLLLQQSGYKLNRGELLKDIFSSLTDNDKIVAEISPEEMEAMTQQQAQEEAMMQEQAMAEEQAMMQQGQPPVEGEVMPEEPSEEQELVNIQAIMEEYNVPENIAMAMREAEMQGFGDDEIMQLKDALLAETEGAVSA